MNWLIHNTNLLQIIQFEINTTFYFDIIPDLDHCLSKFLTSFYAPIESNVDGEGHQVKNMLP